VYVAMLVVLDSPELDELRRRFRPPSTRTTDG